MVCSVARFVGLILTLAGMMQLCREVADPRGSSDRGSERATTVPDFAFPQIGRNKIDNSLG